ncbi:MAG: hypothetical protein PVI26_06590 [Chitinispirillia bacterium]|jgi:hypothetical protein
MRIVGLLIIGVFVFSSLIYGEVQYVQPKSNNVGLYQNEKREVNETAIKKLTVNDRLQIMKKKRNHYQVKADDGTVGWIEIRLVASASGKSFMFDDAEVIGYLDNPTPVYIIDADSKDATPIKLDRSFAEALRQNIDREAVQRQTN